MIACFLCNISAKYYKNPSMLSRVIAKNVGGVFLRHSVERIRNQPTGYRQVLTLKKVREDEKGELAYIK